MASKKNKTTTTTTTTADVQPNETQHRAADDRYQGDSAGMISAKDLERIHGKEKLEANAREAKRIRDEKGR
jgi:hypothetical protein